MSMYQLKVLDDTIVAISTPLGSGGIGIVRLSGKEALNIVDKMFITKNNLKPSQFKSYTVHYGWVINPLKENKQKSEEIIDEVLLTIMRTPQSYTCEDVVEISCHGGIVPLRAILSTAIDLGARLAEPGEFTKRAFLNGRIDLTQAEAVLDIIRSKTDAFLRVSTHQLKGELTLELESIREHLLNVFTAIEAVMNFPEDDIDTKGRGKLLNQIKQALQKVKRLLESGHQGRILKEGIKIVLCGKPNVGKSSLLNVLLKQPRAIVTDIAGTTRDTIEELAQIRGIPFQLVDTAGILEPRDLIEQEAIKRSHMVIKSADLILLVLDASQPISKEDEELISKINEQNVLVVVNKRDLKNQISEDEIKKLLPKKGMIRVSALKKTGIDDLEEAIVEKVLQGESINTNHILVSNIRHINALKECVQALEKTQKILADGLVLEVASEEIKTAINHLDSITGKNVDSDLIDKIFSEFCIGK